MPSSPKTKDMKDSLNYCLVRGLEAIGNICQDIASEEAVHSSGTPLRYRAYL